jgi:hypothetical protein
MSISDEAVEAAAKALRAHFSTEDEGINEFPVDEYLCCARAALEAAADFGPEDTA